MRFSRPWLGPVLALHALLTLACTGDDAADGEATPDAAGASDAGPRLDGSAPGDASGPVDAAPVADAAPPVDGDLVNDAGPLVVGPAYTLDEPEPHDLPAYGAHFVVALGWTGSEYIALESSEGRHVLAQRLSPDGEVLGQPLELSSTYDETVGLHMVCGGGRCLVVWRDPDPPTAEEQLRGVVLGDGLEVITAIPLALGRANAFTIATTPAGFMVARTVVPDGVTLVSISLPGAVTGTRSGIFPESWISDPPVLACGTTTCLLMAHVCPTGSGSCAKRLVVTDPAGQGADVNGQEQSALPKQLLSAGSRFAAVYDNVQEGSTLVRLTDQGLASGAPLVVANTGQVAGAAFDGVAYVVLSYVFEDIHGPTTITRTHVLLSRQAVDGTVLLDRVKVFADEADVVGSDAVAGCHEGLCLVATSKTFGTMAEYDGVVTRLDAGHALDPAGRLVTVSTPAQRFSEIASDGTDFLLVWRQQAPVGDEVRARRIGADGVPSPGGSRVLVPSTTPAASALTGIAGGYLFAWTDAADGKVRLRALDADGAPAAAAVELGQVQVDGGAATSLGLACHAGQCLVAWTDGHVHVQRVREDGVPIDPADIVLQPALSHAAVAVAYNHGQYAVGWTRSVLQNTREDLDVALVPEDGPIIAPAIVAVEERITSFGRTSIVPSGDGFLVGWVGTIFAPTATMQLGLLELSGGGTTGPFAVRLGSASDEPVLRPELVVNGQDVLVSGIVPHGVFGSDLDTDGELRLLRVGSGPRLLDVAPVDAGSVVFRADPSVRGAANAARDVLLVHDVFSNDPRHTGPHAVAHRLTW